MKYLGAFLLVGFVSLAVFGAFGMHMFTEDHDSGCIVATSQGADCPREINPFDSLALHTGILKNFSDAVFGNTSFSALAFFMLLGLSLLLGFLTLNSGRLKIIPVRRWIKPDSFNPPSKYEFNRWLAIHENSPATP